MIDVDISSIRVLSLCSGGGGLDLSVRLAIPSARVECYVENEIYACGVLASRMAEKLLDEAPIWSDVKTFNCDPWKGRINTVVGGFPCQPFSCAGKQLGKADPRHLWPYFVKIIKQLDPDYCFFENVPGLLSIGYEEVRSDLQGLGFKVETGLFSSAEMGAPHLRKRLFILGCHERTLANPSCEGRDGGTGQCNDLPALQAARSSDGDKVLGRENQDVPDSEGRGRGKLRGTQGSHGLPDGSREALANAKSMRGASIKRRESYRILQTLGQNQWDIPVFPPRASKKEWEGAPKALEPAVCNVDDELAAGMGGREQSSRISQLRLLGNGVVPACAGYAFCVLFARILGLDQKFSQ